MNPLKLLRQRLPLSIVVIVGVLVGLFAGVIVSRAVNGELMRRAWDEAIAHPGEVVIASAAFGIAFLLRAIAWQLVLPKLSLGHSLAGIHLTLGANHVLPFRLGEPVRVLSVAKRSKTSIDAATAVCRRPLTQRVGGRRHARPRYRACGQRRVPCESARGGLLGARPLQPT